MTGKYTAADFANARFAEHEDGRLAVRHYPGNYRPWESACDFYSDLDMCAKGWAPVPSKPAITESRLRFLMEVGNVHYRDGFNDALIEFGITVVPSPEPSNAEKLASLMYEADERDTSAISGGWEQVAEYLDAHGVTAPGGDDEH